MSPLSNCVSKLIMDKTNLCRLCLNYAEEEIIQIEDEVIIDANCSENPQRISEIISKVLGSNYAENISNQDSICSDCAKRLISSYKFINMCQENSELLKNAVDTISHCLENTLDNLGKFQTLFVSINLRDLTSQQYYDTNITSDVEAARKRYKAIMKKGTREKKRKIHEFNNEIFEICDVIRDKNGPTMFKCKVCANVSKKLYNFKKHYYSQHSAKVHQCSQCRRRYGSDALLKQHVYDCHSSMVCIKCGKEYSNRYSLLYHMRRHTGEQPYECKYCGAKFQWSSRRAEHIRRYHLEAAVECNICHSKFKTLGSLYEHRKRHYNPNSRLHVTNVNEVEKVA